MKKLFLCLLAIGSLALTGCSNSKKYNLKDFVEFRLYDTGQLVQKWTANGEAYYYPYTPSDSAISTASRDLDNHCECTLFYNSQTHTYTFYGRFGLRTNNPTIDYKYTYKLVYQGTNISISYVQ